MTLQASQLAVVDRVRATLGKGNDVIDLEITRKANLTADSASQGVAFQHEPAAFLRPVGRNLRAFPASGAFPRFLAVIRARDQVETSRVRTDFPCPHGL